MKIITTLPVFSAIVPDRSWRHVLGNLTAIVHGACYLFELPAGAVGFRTTIDPVRECGGDDTILFDVWLPRPFMLSGRWRSKVAPDNELMDFFVMGDHALPPFVTNNERCFGRVYLISDLTEPIHYDSYLHNQGRSSWMEHKARPYSAERSPRVITIPDETDPCRG